MSFDSREYSLADGRPVRLYEFRRGALRWNYCSAGRDLVHHARTWRSSAIADDGVRITGEASAEALQLTGPAELEVAQLYRAAPPSAEIWLTVHDYHDGEIDAPSSSRVAWQGSIVSVRWPRADRCEIVCQSLTGSLSRPGLRLTWERSCPHTIYDRNCRADRNAFRVEATLQSMDGASVSSGAFEALPDGYFAGGWLEWHVGGGELDRRGIEAHAGSELVLLGGTAGLAVGQAVAAYPGCRQTAAYCNDVFDNLDNFGGIRHLPGKSPFDGDPVF